MYRTKIEQGLRWKLCGFCMLFLLESHVPAVGQRNVERQGKDVSTDRNDGVIHGLVVAENGEPLPGVTIKLVGTDKMSVTDLDGRFTMKPDHAAPPYRLSFNYIGMKEEVRTVGEAGHLKVVMRDDDHELAQVVVTGYRTTTKRNMSGSVAVLTDKEFANKVPSTMDNLLQGLVAGVAVSNSGQPGSTSKIRIRGTNTLTGDAEPLWIVDGVPLQDDLPEISNSQLKSGDFNDIFVHGISGINPDDIENVTILKDASAAAIYGSRAAGGVIVVTTRQGKAGKMKVNYSANLISQLKPQRDAKLMNAQEKLLWEQQLWDEYSAERFATGASHVPVIGIVGMLRSGKLGKDGLLSTNENFSPLTSAEQDAYIASLGKQSTNWFEEIFRNSFSMNHHVSVQGGSKVSTYYVSLGYTGNDGLLKESNYKRYNLTTNLNITPVDRLKIQLGIKFSRERSHEPYSSVSPFQYAYFANPYEKPYNDDGSYRSDMTYFNLASMNDGNQESPALPVEGFNILREMEHTAKTADKTTVSGRLNAEYRITDWLRLTGLVSYTHDTNNTESLKEADSYSAFIDRLWYHKDLIDWTPYGSLMQSNSAGDSYNARAQANFSKNVNDVHDISVFAGAEIRGNKTKRFYLKQYGYDPDTQIVTWPDNPNAQASDASQYESLYESLMGRGLTDNRFASFYVSGDYMLMNRYLFNFSFRTDGSNNFGSKEQFNPTYSAGLGWHIDEEKWMKPLSPVVSRMTLRLSGGFTGNVVRGVDKQLVLNYGTNSWNGITTASISSSGAPNPHLRWEKTRDAKVSLDFGLLNNRLNGIVEAYYRKSSDIITSTALVSTTGFTSFKYNTSEIVNKGIELTLQSTVIQKKDFTLQLGGNIAWNRNYLTAYQNTQGAPNVSEGWFVGYPMASVFSGKVLGIDPNTGLYLYQLRPDANIKSYNSLNSIDNYRYYLGTATSPYTGGFNARLSYKQFSLSVSGMFSLGGLVNNMMTSPASIASVSSRKAEAPQSEYSDLYRNHLNVYSEMTNRWTPANTTNVKYPRIVDPLVDIIGYTDYIPSNASIVNGAFMEKVSFAKIRDITLSYSTPQQLLKYAGLSSLNLSLTLNNFFTFTNYTGLDPENPGAMYPTTRSVSFNLSIGF